MRITFPRVALVGVLVVGLGGGAAVASIPNPDGTISACYATLDGNVRIIDPDAGLGARPCEPGEQYLSWSQTGPKGATGPQGPQGPAGPSFIRAVYNDDTHRGDTKVLASIQLPANSYFSVSAIIDSYRTSDSGDPTSGEAVCRLKQLRANGTLDTLEAVSFGYKEGEEYIHQQRSLRHVTYTGNGTDTLQVSCYTVAGEASDRPWVSSVKLEAAQVGGYTLQRL